MRSTLIALAAAGVALASVLTRSASASPPHYAFTSVVIPHESSTQVTGINDGGTYTGFACNDPCRHPKFFFATTRMTTDFGLPFSDFARTFPAGTSGIDDAGEVVGFYTDAGGAEHGFVRAPSGKVSEFSAPGAAKVNGGGGTSIDGVSAAGVIVGDYFDRNDVEHGFIKRQQGRLVTYNEPDAGRTKGTGTQINFYLNGEFGGLYFSGNGSEHGFYVLNGTPHSVDSPTLRHPSAGYGTELSAASDSGTLYGTVSPPGAPTAEGFADRGGVFVNIRDPEQLGATDSSGTFVSNVNLAGTVVGNYSYDASGHRKGMVARPGG